MGGRASYVVLLSVVLLFGIHCCIAQRLPKLNVDRNAISVSGVSSGGAMAIQMHVAYSKTIMGVGAFAAPPYWCAMDTLQLALTSCTIAPGLISLSALWAGTAFAYSTGSIDNPAYLHQDRVWLFTGTLDSVVYPGVVEATHQYYKHYVPSDSSYLEGSIEAEHAWITDSWGDKCDYLGSPYINNCGFDAAQSLLGHIYNSTALNAKTKMISSNLKQFNQAYYIPLNFSPSTISMGDVGFVYIPTACSTGVKCKLHVSFHGCLQSYTSVNSDFVVHSGLNEWAESNRIIVLYPQAAKSSVLPYNPEGCWDWWGYTGTAYATQLAPQMITIKNMINALTG